MYVCAAMTSNYSGTYCVHTVEHFRINYSLNYAVLLNKTFKNQ